MMWSLLRSWMSITWWKASAITYSSFCLLPYYFHVFERLSQWFSSFHGLWPPSKDCQHLWSPIHQQGFAISRQSYSVKATARGPQGGWGPRFRNLGVLSCRRSSVEMLHHPSHWEKRRNWLSWERVSNPKLTYS